MLLLILDVFFTLISNLPGAKPYLLRKISYSRKSKMAAVTNITNNLIPLISLISPLLHHLIIDSRCFEHAELKYAKD